MDIKITIDMPALDRFVDALVAGQTPAVTPRRAPQTKAPEQAPKADTPAADPPAEPDTPAADGAATIEEVRAAAIKYQAANGREGLTTLLKEFDAKNLTALGAEHYADFLAKAAV